MVLAQMLKNRDYEEGFRKGAADERRRMNKELIAWAKEKGIPIEDLPIEAGYRQGFVIGYKEGITQGVADERRRKKAALIAWAKKKGIPLEDLPLAQD